MAEEESNAEEPEEQEDSSEEVAKLRAEVEELRAQLEAARSGGQTSPTARWAGWILGTLVGATALAFIVAFLGGGLQRTRECPEAPAEPAPDGERELDRSHEALNRYISEHSGELQTCFESWASDSSEARPGLRIVAVIEVDVDESNTVTNVEVRGDDVPDTLSACLVRTVRAWRVPLAGQFVLELPFEVRGGGSETARPPDGGLGADAPVDGGPAETEGDGSTPEG